MKISITSTENQKINKNKNISIINLGECENKIKEEYNIPNNESLLIYKLDILKSEMKVPRIEYEVYYPLYENKLFLLNLSICKDIKINIDIPIIINEKDIDKLNINSKYYKDICYKAKSDNNTDITLNDRKEEYINKYMNPCEENCLFEEYQKDIKKAKCLCNIKDKLKYYSEISRNRTLLLKGFKDINNIMNLNIMKCYYILFNIDNISNNIGFYIILFVLIFHFIVQIIFYKKDYNIIKNKISDIIKSLKNLNYNHLKSKMKIIINVLFLIMINNIE